MGYSSYHDILIISVFPRRSNSEMAFFSGEKMWKYKSRSDEWAVAEPSMHMKLVIVA